MKFEEETSSPFPNEGLGPARGSDRPCFLPYGLLPSSVRSAMSDSVTAGISSMFVAADYPVRRGGLAKYAACPTCFVRPTFARGLGLRLPMDPTEGGGHPHLRRFFTRTKFSRTENLRIPYGRITYEYPPTRGRRCWLPLLTDRPSAGEMLEADSPGRSQHENFNLKLTSKPPKIKPDNLRAFR